MDNVTLVLAFTGGVLSFFSPCVFPLVPAFLANLAGASAQAERQTWTALAHALSFVLGFSLIFIALGVMMGLAGSLLAGYREPLRWIAGGILIIFGLQLMGVLKMSFLYRERRLSYQGGATPGYLRSLLTGSAFSLGWTPCVSVVLSGILALTLTTATVPGAVGLLGLYSLGLGLPFLAFALAVTPLTRWMKHLGRYLRVVSLVSGLLLIVLGILVMTNQLAALNKYFTFFTLG